MTQFLNLFSVLWRGILLLAGALVSLLRLVVVGLSALRGEGSLGQRLGARFGEAGVQRDALKLLRTFAPNLLLRLRIVKAYDNSGTALVTRDPDVREVLDHDWAFQVVYEPRMKKVTGGGEFFLGMQHTAEYTRDVANMRLSARQGDLAAVVTPSVAAEAYECVAKSNGRLDFPQTLAGPVQARLVGRYFGTPGPSEADLIEWTKLMFWYLFIDLGADPEIETKALAAAQKCRDYLDSTIARRKANPGAQDDVLGRCLQMQSAGLPGLDDVGIRNNLIGLIIGATPTIPAACALALDVLLDRPDELRGAHEAAVADNDELLAAYVFEAFRFNPLNPIIFRRATSDFVIAKGTLRARRIPKGTMVLAANLSAMFDGWTIPDPDAFRLDRPWSSYILFGYGLHTCFGEDLNRAVIPQILKPLLAQKGLRRAPGDKGRIDKDGTPFPVHLELEFDPS